MFKKLSTYLILILINNFVCLSKTESLNPPLVQTKNGLLEGVHHKTYSGRLINAFLGIPFSTPPIGKNRFEPPSPAKSWSGIYYANETKPPCLQFNHYLLTKKLNPIVGNEDCLYLNIYTPKIMQDLNENLTDVIVFIHGGSFMYGKSNAFHPTYLLDSKDFIFITISYRLGPFGFLSTQDEIVPGNNGLKDQVMALKWIKTNIKSFGGDPSKVTIAGFSAGGASVHLHYLSPMSKNLFQKGISLSGTSLCPWAYTEEPKEKAVKLAKSLNCPITDSTVMIDCLKQISGEMILSKIKPLFLGWLYNPITPFGPTAEIINTQQFLPDHPYKLLKQGNVHDLPWLVGFSTEEGLYPASEFILNKQLMKELHNHLLERLPYLLDYDTTIKNRREKDIISEKIIQNYLKSNTTILSKRGRNSLIRMISDRLYINAIDKSTKLHSNNIKSLIYLYNFGYRGKNSFSDMFTGLRKNLGVSHGDDTAYVFNSFFSCTDRENDKLMINFMVDLFSSFIKNNESIIMVNRNTLWEPIRKNRHNSTIINFLAIKSHNDIRMLTSNNLGNNLFWNSLNYSEFNYEFT